MTRRIACTSSGLTYAVAGLVPTMLLHRGCSVLAALPIALVLLAGTLFLRAVSLSPGAAVQWTLVGRRAVFYSLPLIGVVWSAGTATPGAALFVFRCSGAIMGVIAGLLLMEGWGGDQFSGDDGLI
jgi:hypothetical protein